MHGPINISYLNITWRVQIKRNWIFTYLLDVMHLKKKNTHTHTCLWTIRDIFSSYEVVALNAMEDQNCTTTKRNDLLVQLTSDELPENSQYFSALVFSHVVTRSMFKKFWAVFIKHYQTSAVNNMWQWREIQYDWQIPRKTVTTNSRLLIEVKVVMIILRRKLTISC